MRFLYNILFIVFFLLTAPYYFWRMRRRGNWMDGFGERFAIYSTNLKQALTNRQVIWLHAVSVGEVNVCTHLVRALEARLPNVKIVVSTTTTTGMEGLKKNLPQHVSKIYYPIDRRKYVAKAMAVVKPDAIVLVEAEIWPNFIWRARGQRIPLFLVNARVSDRSYPRYKRAGFIFRNLFGTFSGVGAQNTDDVERLRGIGCEAEAVRVTGNLKFDAAVSVDNRPKLDVRGILQQLGVAPNAPVLVCGSTHDGEEAILGKVFLRLREKFPNLFLIMVPRHFERAREAGRDLEAAGVKINYRTEVNAQTRHNPGDLHCLVVNTTGELKYFYEPATVVFVGKSIAKKGEKGGQSPIEPAALGKAIVFGPNMRNFKDVVKLFLSGNGAVQVRDAAELEAALATLLADEPRRAQLGHNAAQVVHNNLGATERTVDMILEQLDPKSFYIAGGK